MKVNSLRALVFFSAWTLSMSFTLTMMGAKRGRGNLKRQLEDTSSKQSPVSSMNQGKGQEITGVTLPSPGNVKGWEFGKNQQLACANVDGDFYVVQGTCPRCAFDLYKGEIVTDPAFGDNPADLPRIACPTCSTTFSLRDGTHGPALKRSGLGGFVASLAKTATIDDAARDAKAFVLTIEDDRVFLREK